MKLLLTILMFLPAVAAAGVTYDTLSNASVTDDTFSAASVSYDTVALNIQTVTVSAPLKRDGDYRRLPVAASTLGSKELNGDFIVEPKNLSLTVPNMMHADYGARMTGSIYMRGLGSRMDQPAVGLYVDGVPVMNKNNYDFDYFDLARIDVLRGPQGTLYGRNTVGGVVDVQTLSPMDYQGVRVGAGYGNGNSWHVQGAVYARPTAKFGFSVAASHRATDGFFTNSFDGSHADSGRSSALRFKLQGRLGRGWMVENSLYANLVRQNGFAYAPYDEATGRAGIIDHNDPTTYDRVGLTDGLTFRRDGARVRVSSTTSWQFTDDDMVLDQDFSPRSMFTLRQSQRENAFTQEVVLRSATSGGSQARRWQWLTGFFGFYRHLETEAPVVFKRDGIDELILANANNGIHTAFPDADLLIREESFPVDSRFRLPAYGLSLYHQSTWRRGRWSLTAGVRADWEHTAINYTNSAEIHYRFTLTMPDYKALPVEMNGRRGKAYFEVMPRVAAMYELPAGSLYASIARGYKAGGYNTQIFSDIVQNRMMGALMEDLGVYFDGVGEGGSAEDAISYRPERSWNYEVGGHFGWLDGRLQVDAALFWIDCRNQQLTVFPAGNGIGRLMSNAGRTRSAGAEVAAAWRVGDLRLTGAWGHTSARFLSYDDGREDYAGNIVPYAPRNTVSLQGEYRIGLSGRGGASGDSSGGGVFSGASALLLTVGGQAAGPIVWNEGNTLTQRLYGLMNASVAWETARLSVSVWARNMTGTEYNTFYFKSVGRSFVQRGKPLQAGVTVALNL